MTRQRQGLFYREIGGRSIEEKPVDAKRDMVRMALGPAGLLMCDAYIHISYVYMYNTCTYEVKCTCIHWRKRLGEGFRRGLAVCASRQIRGSRYPVDGRSN